MAVAYQSSQTANANGTSVTVTKPTSTASGDLLIGHFTAQADTRTVTPPSGWTEIYKQDGNNHIAGFYYKVAGGSEPANYSWTIDGASANLIGAIARITGQGTLPTVLLSDNDTFSGTSEVMTFTASVTPFATTSSIMMLLFSQQTGSGALAGSGYVIDTDDPADWSEGYDVVPGGYNIASHLATSITRTELTATGGMSISVGNAGNSKTGTGVILFIAEDRAVTVTGTTGLIDITGLDGSVVGNANIAGSVGLIDITGNTGAVTTPEQKWKNTPKTDTSPSITNTPKS